MSGGDDIIVRMSGVCKSFGDIQANDRVDFELLAGEIHALLGENGAGKSTLMNILAGFYRADAGRIEVDGRAVAWAGPREALAAGIGMVHQNFMLVKGHTVAENVILGLPGTFRLDTRSLHAEIRRLAEEYRLPVDPAAPVWQLSIGERQRVEILKLLYRRTRILILDEPTAVLTPGEADSLFETLRRLRDSGGSVVFISHKLEEVMNICDRVTVLRGGRKVATIGTTGVSSGDLAGMMVGEMVVPVDGPSPRAGIGREILSLRDLRASSDRGLPALRGIDLDVREGEIFALLGVAGNGQKELAEAVTGLRKPIGGKILVGGRDLTGAGPRDFIEAGVAHIPEDRLGMGIAGGLTLAENLALKSFRRPPHASGIFLRPSSMIRAAEDLIRDYGILPGDPRRPAWALSGGNSQRLILAREFSGSPRLLVAAYPFRGLDVAACDFLGRLLRERAAAGLAVLLVADDLDLALGLAHRVGVIFEGRLSGVRPAHEANLEEIGLLMAGQGTREGVS